MIMNSASSYWFKLSYLLLENSLNLFKMTHELSLEKSDKQYLISLLHELAEEMTLQFTKKQTNRTH